MKKIFDLLRSFGNTLKVMNFEYGTPHRAGAQYSQNNDREGLFIYA